MKKHLAGIVPVSGLRTDFNMPWHESLMPIGPNYLAVERAVAECAYIGCDTIWIVCADDVTPLIRHQVGEKIQDPVYNYRHFELYKNDVKKPIRIYYVPLSIKDINKRDNLAWSAIFGAKTANKILGALSKHVKPDSFYISWPYAYYAPFFLREHRKVAAQKPFLLSHNGETIKDNKYLSFTIDSSQIEDLLEESVTTSSGLYQVDDIGARTRLPLEERYSYKEYDLKQVFSSLDFSNYERVEIEDYACIDNWVDYCDFLSSHREIRKPKLLKYSEWNQIGVDDEECDR